MWNSVVLRIDKTQSMADKVTAVERLLAQDGEVDGHGDIKGKDG